LPVHMFWIRAVSPPETGVAAVVVDEVADVVAEVPGEELPAPLVPGLDGVPDDAPAEGAGEVVPAPAAGLPIVPVAALGAGTAPVGETANAIVVRHVGLPAGEESSISVTGKAPRMGVVWRSV
jgi:hypothetical protein